MRSAILVTRLGSDVPSGPPFYDSGSSAPECYEDLVVEALLHSAALAKKQERSCLGAAFLLSLASFP